MNFAKLLKPNLWLYSFLSRFGYPFKKSYKSKIMLVAFIGTHVPLLSLLTYFIISTSLTFDVKVRVIVIALLATLIGTGLTLYALHNLLAPVTFTFLALRKYLSHKQLPNLPTEFTDEVGILMTDTSYTLKKLDEIIYHTSNYDNLTGLPNRNLFRSLLNQAISQEQSNNHLLAVISLELDRFKEINNTLGHSKGDLLLRSAAHRLSNCIPELNIILSFDSNKFTILQTNITSLNEVIALSEKLINALDHPFSLDGDQVYTGGNIGISIYPDDNNNVDLLLGNADNAMYQANQKGRNSYQFYSAELNTNLQERLNLENELYNALKQDELFLYYQPKLSLHSDRIVGVEALLRWKSPKRGFVSPANFIPIAEASGLILPIGEWVLRTACAQNLTLQQEGLSSIKIAVNLSASQFKQLDLVEMTAQILAQTGVDPSYLELEVTESMLMENVQQAITILQELHDMGIALSLDDFGTGYSSLNYLKRFPIDTLKIDQSFVRDLVLNSDDAVITQAIISLAHNLQLSVIAEGVETQEQFNHLKAIGCDEIQGYYFSKPITADALAKFLSSHRL